MPWSLPPQPALATDRFILILTTLWKWVWEKPGKEMTGLVSLEIRRKLVRARLRFESLARRFHAGTLAPPQPRATPRKPPDSAPAGPKPRTPSILPRHFGWLCGLVPSYAAAAGSQMMHHLQDPQMEAMAAASPEVGKLIRPLLWMTGQMPPSYLALPPRTKRARAGLPPGPRRVAPAPPPPAPVSVRPADPFAAPPCLPRNPNGPPPPPLPPEPQPERWKSYRFHPNSPLKGLM
jgi:hypothetical protein